MYLYTNMDPGSPCLAAAQEVSECTRKSGEKAKYKIQGYTFVLFTHLVFHSRTRLKTPAVHCSLDENKALQRELTTRMTITTCHVHMIIQDTKTHLRCLISKTWCSHPLTWYLSAKGSTSCGHQMSSTCSCFRWDSGPGRVSGRLVRHICSQHRSIQA